MNKKRIFGIVVFVILGLFMFTFANSLNDNDDNKTNQAQSGNTTKENGEATENNQENAEEAPRVARRANNANQAAARQVQQPAAEQPAAEVKPAEKVEEQKPAEEKPADEKPAEEVIKEEGNDKIDLTLDKLNAIKELKDYKKGYPFDNKEDYNNVIEEYSEKINASETADDIKSNLNDGKKAIDELIAKDLEAYKKAAKKEILEYAKKLDLSTDITKLIYKSFKDINNAKFKFQVKGIVKNTKKALDGIAAKELADAKRKAKEEIKKYRKDDEKYISSITYVKADIYKKIDKATSKKDLPGIVAKGKKTIDGVIANTKFTVKFYDFDGNKINTQFVTYKKDAKAPFINEKVKKYNGYVVYKFDKWSEDFTNVKSNIKVYAQYSINKLYADVYADNDKIVEKVKLNVTDELKDVVKAYKGHSITLEMDATEVVKSELPKIYDNNKYKTITYNAIKFTDKGFKVIGTVYYDELGEAKDTLKELIKKAEKVDTEGKTNASIKALNDDIDTAKEVVKGSDLEAIKKSIEALSNIKLVDIKVTEVTVVNKKASYVEGQPLVLEVRYSNNNGVENKALESGYTINGDTKTVGSNTATVTYKGVESLPFNYTVVAKKIVSFRVVVNKNTYYKNEKVAESDLTVTATYNDDDTKVLKMNTEYTVDNLYTTDDTYNFWGNQKREATVKVGNLNPYKYKYTVEKKTIDEHIDEVNKELMNKISIHVSDNKIKFKNATDAVTIKSVQRVNKKIFSSNKVYDINLINIGSKHEFGLNDSDYSLLRNTNTFFANQYIRIKYVINGKEYSHDYYEIFGDVF